MRIHVPRPHLALFSVVWVSLTTDLHYTYHYESLFRQPFPCQLRCVSPLPVSRLGNQGRPQILRGLSPVQEGSRIFACRVCKFPRNYLERQCHSLVRFALVVVPVYEDQQDQEASPFNLPNSTPFSWSWFSTINRANSQVQKVLSFRSSDSLNTTCLDPCTGLCYDPC